MSDDILSSFRTQIDMSTLVIYTALILALPSQVANLVIIGLCRLLIYREHSAAVSGDPPQVTHLTRSNQDSSPFFAKLPAEIRNEVYRDLLISRYGGKISRPDRMLKIKSWEILYEKKPLEADEIPIDIGIDVTIHCTCHRAYKEALPILYGDNTFEFSEATQLIAFKTAELAKRASVALKSQTEQSYIFGLELRPQGRFSMIRKLKLDLTTTMRYFSQWIGHPQSRQMAREVTQIREHIASHWKLLWSEESDDVLFPNLEQLALNFSAWRLEVHHCIAVRPFAQKLRAASGLKILKIYGIWNRENLRQFRRKLLRADGRMICDVVLEDD